MKMMVTNCLKQKEFCFFFLEKAAVLSIAGSKIFSALYELGVLMKFALPVAGKSHLFRNPTSMLPNLPLCYNRCCLHCVVELLNHLGLDIWCKTLEVYLYAAYVVRQFLT
jgi:hypothetical protein